MSHPDARSRIVVVGGGVSGLAASHTFQEVAIDHVALERRLAVAPKAGVSIAIYPNGSSRRRAGGGKEPHHPHGFVGAPNCRA